MFEKEAEEYIKTNNLEWELECHRTSPIGEVKHAFLAGAEFGYNKGNDEVITEAKEIIKNLLILKNDHYGNTKMGLRVEVTERAEQFLKENK